MVGKEELDAVLERGADERIVTQTTATTARFANHTVLPATTRPAHTPRACDLEALGSGLVRFHLGH
jgi:hypothetical protein